jgi:hypothetical protein
MKILLIYILISIICLGIDYGSLLSGKIVQIEQYKLSFGTIVSNLEANTNLTQVSNTLIKYGGWYCENSILMINLNDSIIMWTNLNYNENTFTAFNKYGNIVNIIIKEN